MVNIDDIIKRSRYLNMSNKQQEYDKYHVKSKLLMESNLYRFDNVKFLLQHWESLSENQDECFRKVIDILDETYENDNVRDFNYTKAYIVNEVVPTVRNAKQSARYLKYKTTIMKNKITRKLKKNVENIKAAASLDAQQTKNRQTVDKMKSNIKKSLGQTDEDKKNIKKEEVHEAYVLILDTLDKYNHCDRILENNYNIQKRFNIMNMIEKTDINEDAALCALVDSICECVNTYDSSFGARFNTALETCFYFLSREDASFNKSLVLEEVVNNFISQDLSSENLREMKFIIESSVVYDDKSSVDFIYTATPFEDVTELAKPFLESKNENMIKLGKTIRSISNDMTDTDIKKVFNTMRNISESNQDLRNDLDKESLDMLMYKLSFFHSGEDFDKLCAQEVNYFKKYLNNNSENNPEPNYIQVLAKYGSKCNLSESVLITDFIPYNEGVKESVKNTVKDIINDFKMAKVKKATDVRTCVSKMFTKSPDQIIDGTPNFLSWVRLTYVIGATAIHPILGGVTLIVDKFIEMKLKRRDTDKMITAFKNEKKKVAEKLKKTVDEKDKKNLQEYEKYLDKGLEKLIKYRESLMSSHELDSEEFGEDYDKEQELKDIFGDEDDGKDFDYSTESTSFEKLIENSNYFSKEYFTNNITKSIYMMDEDAIDTITHVACKYPTIINTSKLYASLKEEYDNIRNTTNKWVRMSCLSSNLRKLDPESEEYIVTNGENDSNVFEIMNGLEDLFTEYSINKSMNITNESMSTMVKSITNKIRKTMQKASDIDKETSKKIDSSVNMFISGIQRATRNENREAIIRGSILPSASKIVKLAITTGAIALVQPAIAVITSLGYLVLRKTSQKKERQLVLDEIDIELEMCKRYLRQAEDQNDLEAQKRILQIQRNLLRQKQRIEYNMKVNWKQDVPNPKKMVDDDY